MAADPQPSNRRDAQRRRTRRAIVDATTALIAAGNTPTISDIAAAADVSRRTVYLYFPSLEHLLVDATLGALSQRDIDSAIDAVDTPDDAAERLDALSRSVQSMSPEIEHLGRQLIRLTVDSTRGGELRDASRRGYRRLEWIEAALAPTREQVSTAHFDRLVHALAVVIGWEALIVQRDICGLTPAEGEELSAWMARVLLDATLAEAAPPDGAPDPAP